MKSGVHPWMTCGVHAGWLAAGERFPPGLPKDFEQALVFDAAGGRHHHVLRPVRGTVQLAQGLHRHAADGFAHSRRTAAFAQSDFAHGAQSRERGAQFVGGVRGEALQGFEGTFEAL